MELRILSLEDCEQVRLWRNQSMESLRTPYELTREMQAKFYGDVICNPDSPHRYWGIWKFVPLQQITFTGSPPPIGYGGITNIQWENRIGEISLLIDPTMRDKGYGKEAVRLLLDKAFNYLNLQTVCGEVYTCNPSAWDFWKKLIKASAHSCWQSLPNRKYWQGRFWSGTYFSFDRGDYVK